MFGVNKVQISIIGSKGSGKTTLFMALGHIKGDIKQAYEATTVFNVPDKRLDRLAEMFKPKSTVHARIMVSDTPPINKVNPRDEKEGGITINHLRESDAFILVLRDFENGFPKDPKGEFLSIYHEFILSDIIQIENRLDRIKTQKGKKEHINLSFEEASLKACLDQLDRNEPLSCLSVLNEDEKIFRGFRFLSQKPMIVVVNSEEEGLFSTERIVGDLRTSIPSHIPIIVASAVLERELASLSPAEQKELIAAYGIEEVISSSIIRLAYEVLGLISFFTVGEDECRAWAIRNGLNAQKAAGVIHTDLSKKFIRAEVVSYEDFMRLNGFSGCKKAGLWRLEGKTYIVQDGDILTIRAGN